MKQTITFLDFLNMNTVKDLEYESQAYKSEKWVLRQTEGHYDLKSRCLVNLNKASETKFQFPEQQRILFFSNLFLSIPEDYRHTDR